jgi:hypothetical protein
MNGFILVDTGMTKRWLAESVKDFTIQGRPGNGAERSFYPCWWVERNTVKRVCGGFIIK